jgi:hypothetical protein
MSKFLTNKTAAHVSLLEGRVFIPQGGHTEISDEQAEHSEIIDVKNRGWVSISAEEPGTPAEGTPLVPLVMENEKLKGSLTPPGKPEAVPVPEVVVEVAVEVAPEVAPAAPEVAVKAKKTS